MSITSVSSATDSSAAISAKTAQKATEAKSQEDKTAQVKQQAKQEQVKGIQVDISALAKKLASDGDTQAKEITESAAEKNSEKLNNKA